MSTFDVVREDLRIQLAYILGEGTYDDLCADTEGITSPREAIAKVLQKYTDISKHYLANSTLRDNLSTYYAGARLDLQVQKTIRKYARREDLAETIGTDDANILYGVVTVMVNYFKAHTVADIIYAYKNDDVVTEQIDLMVAAMEQINDDAFPFAAYPLMFIPCMSSKLMNADFVVYAVINKETIKKRALSMSKEQNLAMSKCLFSILSKEYETYKEECGDGYDPS